MKKWLIRILSLIALLAFTAYGLKELSSSRDFQFFGGIVQKIETKEKIVALTFDDGPTEQTDDILAVLNEADVKATFFLTGREIKGNLEAAKKVAAAGHELGNHSFSHKRMVFKTPGFIREEIEETDELIRKAGYEGPIPFRPPYGKKLVLLPYYLDKHNRHTILWNLEPDSYADIASDSEKIVKYVKNNVTPGSIILLHVMYESRKESLEAVKGIVRELKADGYSFKTVSEMLND